VPRPDVVIAITAARWPTVSDAPSSSSRLAIARRAVISGTDGASVRTTSTSTAAAMACSRAIVVAVA
jgi:hypothetical protein